MAKSDKIMDFRDKDVILKQLKARCDQTYYASVVVSHVSNLDVAVWHIL